MPSPLPMEIETHVVAGRATATSRLPSPLKSPTAIAADSSAEKDRRDRVGRRGLERAVAGTQVDAVRRHDVEDAVVGEVADGDRARDRILNSPGQAGRFDPGRTTG